MQKMKSRKGFTLIEMLIVVGIIAILVAVSIPMVNSSLEKARRATDAANERAAKAEFTIAYLSDMEVAGEKFETKKVYAYDAANGTLADTATPYGKSKDDTDRTDMFIIGQVEDDGTVTLGWATGTSSAPDTDTLVGIDVDGSSAAAGGD